MPSKKIILDLLEACNAVECEAISGGITNSSFKLTRTDGSTSFVTISDYRHGIRKYIDEIDLGRLLKNAGVNTPRIISIGSFYIERELLCGINLDEFFLNSEDLHDQKRVISGFGETISKLHTIKFRHFGKIDYKKKDGQSKTWISYLEGQLDQINLRVARLGKFNLIGKFGILDLRSATESTMSVFRDAKPFLEQVMSPRLIHADARFANFMAKSDAGTWMFDSIVDLDCCIAGDPELDIVQIENWLQFAPYADKIIRFKDFISVGDKFIFTTDSSKRLKWRFYHCLRSLEYLLDVAEMRSNDPEAGIDGKLISYVSKHLDLIRKQLYKKNLKYQFI